ncbi:MAG: D-aminoacyl-tRNA deacylase [Candidatus Delongbacteria bacterium]
MRILLQRVAGTSIRIDGITHSTSGRGLLLFVGISVSDDENVIPYCADKVLNLRIFEDVHGKMNLSVNDIEGDIAVVSQFTLYADTKKGRRPGFSDSAEPQMAKTLFNSFVSELQKSGLRISEGRFGSHMEVNLTNDGPATFMIEK